MMNGGNLSIADAMALRNNNGFEDNGFAWIWIILIFALFNGNGFGWNGYNGANGWNAVNNETDVLNASIQRGFDNQNVMQRFAELQSDQNYNAKENAMLIQNAMYQNSRDFSENTMATLNAANDLNCKLSNGFYAVTSGLNENRFASQQCCCETNRNIDSLRYDSALNTNAITNAIHHEGELTRGLIQQNVIQDLRDRLEEKDRLYQAANFQISQNVQSQNIINSLRTPTPIPAYITASPYASAFYGCGCGNYGYGNYGTTIGTYSA